MTAALAGPFAHRGALLEAAALDATLGNSPLAIRALIWLSERTDRAGRCYCSIRKLAERLGAAPCRLRQALRKLEALGYFAMVRRGGRALYDFLLPIDREAKAQPAELPGPEADASGSAARPRSGPAPDFGERGATRTSGSAARPGTSGSAARPELRGARRDPEPPEPGVEPPPEPGPVAGGGPPDRGAAGGMVRFWTEHGIRDERPQAVQEATRAIVELIRPKSPEVVSERLSEALRGAAAGPGEIAERLRRAADHADAEIRESGDQAVAGLHWGAVFFKDRKPIRADSEAAAVHRRRKRRPERAPGRPGAGPGPAELLTAPPGPVLDFAVGRPDPGPEPESEAEEPGELVAGLWYAKRAGGRAATVANVKLGPLARRAP